MRRVRRPHILHHIARPALLAPPQRPLTRNLNPPPTSQHSTQSPPAPAKGSEHKTHRKPNRRVRIRRTPRTPAILLLAETLHHDGVLQGADAVARQRPHVEHVDALHLAEDLEALEAGGLLEVGRDGAGGGALGEQVRLAADVLEALVHVAAGLGAGGDLGADAVGFVVVGA